MARLGSFDVCAFPATWFDTTGDISGWTDHDVIPFVEIVPPPPPPPPPPPRPKPRRRRSGGGGGGSGGGPSIGPYIPPAWLQPWLLPPYECAVLCPEEDGSADFILAHVTPGADVRALVAGVVEPFVDGKGRRSIVLTADDGARHWYADVADAIVEPGTRVQAGQVIARTQPDAKAIPPLTAAMQAPEIGASAPKALPAAKPPRKDRPAQIVFIEPPPAPPSIAKPLPPPARRLVRLVPIAPPPPPPTSVGETVKTALLMAAGIGVFAAAIYLLQAFASRPPPRLPPKRKPKRRRRRRDLR